MHVKVKMGRDGIWYARPYMGTDALGRQIKPYRRFPDARDEEEAQRLAEAWASHLTADGKVRSALLVDLLGEYIAMCGRNGASPNSLKSYRLFTYNYVRTYLKNVLAQDLTVLDVNRFQQRLLTPKKDGGQGLSRNSVTAIYNFLRGAYNYFVSAGICEGNPVAGAVKPRPEHAEAFALDEYDFAATDAALEADLSPESEDEASVRRAVYAFAAWIVLRTGLRCGEVCAVRRRDVNRMARYVHVGGNVIEETGKRPYRREVTKGKRSRNVTVTEHDIAVVTDFMALLDRTLGPFGADSPLVTVDGTYMRPSTVSEAFSAIRDRLGLPKRLTFHGLRHTHATWCLMNGIDVKTLQERLGHASPSITLNTYAHVLPGRDALAATAFEDAARRARGK